MSARRRLIGVLAIAGVLGLASAAELTRERAADELGTGLRGPAPLDAEPKAPRMARVENFDVRRGRAYTSQPPTIPHAIEKYEITRNVNFCMYCHARVRNPESQAPMISATHYMDRDQNYLAEISPRRYFCTQCHVVQTDALPLVDNVFMDVQELLEREQAGSKNASSERATAGS
jgi:cytochrome c-type protein NapB